MRKTFIILLCSIAVLLAGYVGYRSYKVWKCNHLMGLAHQFLARADGRNALLCAQQVLRSDPRNLAAARMMGQLSEAARSPSALLWWTRVVELNPCSLDDRLALAQAALLMRDYAAATNALAGVDAAGQSTVAYHTMAGKVAAAANQPARAEAEFGEAARQDPDNQNVQLDLAVVRLHGSNDLDQAEARITLQRICLNTTNSFLRCQSLRELAVDALHHQQTAEALSLSKQLVEETNSAFEDRLLRLEVLQKTGDAGFQPTLAAFQREAAGDPAKISELATWQMAKTSPRDTLAWLLTLPPDMRTNQTVGLLIAENDTALQDWRGLQASVQPQYWAELEFIRHAFLSRALRGQGLEDSAQAEWELALKDANGRKASLDMLLRLAVQWNWESESEDLLWTIVKQNPGDQWAVRTLAQALYLDGHTRSLMQLFNQESQRDPSNLSTKNDLAVTAMLLDAQELKPYDLAREVYQQSPTNAAYASTYAFSLYKQGKNAEALKVMKTLTPLELETPAIAGYYGLILKATGDRARAEAYLDWSARARWLPEEKALFDQAKAGL
jgi:predicted Zn-dependent protease